MKLREIYDWAEERGLNDNQPSREGFVAMIVEEQGERLEGVLNEAYSNNSEDIKEAGYEIIDAIGDKVVFAIGEIYKYKFDAEELLGKGDIRDWIDNYKVDDHLNEILGFNERVTFYLYNFLENETPEGRVQEMKNMVIDCFIEMIEEGFDPDLCMNEIMKEISSRTGAYDETAAKWKKFKTPEAKALWYKADFSKCRLRQGD